ncbi:MAG: hypothetical protein RR598_11975 [Anaerorhabdus sp.]
MDKDIIESINALQCKVNETIYWSGFIDGATLIFVIWGSIAIYKYFKNKDVKVKIEISERKEPRL